MILPYTAVGILDELDPSERKLFSDNIRRLDKRIHQGMTKLTWSSKGTFNESLPVLLMRVHVKSYCTPWDCGQRL